MKKFLCLALVLCLGCPTVRGVVGEEELPVSGYAAVLMEQSTGTVIYDKNGNTPLPPASVTKIMTILLVMEAIERGEIGKEDVVVVSATAAGMGGSQVYLKEGETMSVWELLKCVVVVSGNDASVALAEHIAGSEDLFVGKMNQRAGELGMHNTLFFNCTGLPQEGHSTTAYDIGLMSIELMENHPDITELTTIWMDTIREGEFGLSNTNKLIHSYSGATGLKTGSTDSALYCMSSTATRDGLSLVAVVMKSPTSAQRFEDVSSLLDYGFAHYTMEEVFPESALPPIPVTLGETAYVQPNFPENIRLLLTKEEVHSLTTKLELPEVLEAPVEQGEEIGRFHIYIQEQLKETVPIYGDKEVKRLTLWGIYEKMLGKLFMSY